MCCVLYVVCFDLARQSMRPLLMLTGAIPMNGAATSKVWLLARRDRHRHVGTHYKLCFRNIVAFSLVLLLHDGFNRVGHERARRAGVEAVYVYVCRFSCLHTHRCNIASDDLMLLNSRPKVFEGNIHPDAALKPAAHWPHLSSMRIALAVPSFFCTIGKKKLLT